MGRRKQTKLRKRFNRIVHMEFAILPHDPGTQQCVDLHGYLATAHHMLTTFPFMNRKLINKVKKMDPSTATLGAPEREVNFTIRRVW